MNPSWPKSGSNQRAGVIALAYAVLAALWIFLSDSVLALLLSNPEQITNAQTLKGWFFVAITSGLLFLLARWQISAVETAHAEMRTNAERLRSTLTSINDIVFVLDLQYRFVACYQPDAKILPIPPGEFIDKRIDAVGLPDETARHFINAIDALKSNEQLVAVDYPLHLPSGRRWFSAHFSRLLDSAGEVSGVTCVVRDITPIKDIEAAAMSAQALSDTLIDSLPGVFFLIDVNNRLLRWNAQVEKLTGRYGPWT